MSYTIYGPFTNGAAPGIQASFLNGVENFLVTINSSATDSNISSDNSGNMTVKSLLVNTPYTSVPGTSGGTIYMWEFFTGTFKQTFIYVSNYTNNTGTKQRLTLPQAYTTGGICTVGQVHVPSASNGIYILDAGAVTRSWHVFTGYNTVTSQQQLPCMATGEFFDAMTYIEIDANCTSAAFGWIWIAGV